MARVVPIYSEASRFIGVWAQSREFSATLESLAELGGLAKPTLMALTQLPVSRTENHGSIWVGENIGFLDGVFLMIDGEKTPPEDVKAGRSFTAIAFHGIPIAQRTDKAPSSAPKKWWQFWR